MVVRSQRRNPELKQLNVWVQSEEVDALRLLCKTEGISVSDVLRKWITRAVVEQTTELNSTAYEKNARWTETTMGHKTSSVAPETLQVLMKRMEALERAMPKFDVDDLVRMRREVLGGEFGSMRNRIGVVETQIQSLGGNISWTTSEPSGSIED